MINYRRLPGDRTILTIFLAVLLASVVLKVIYLKASNVLPLGSDAPGFVEHAANMTNFYGTSVREPFWILWVKCCAGIFPRPATGMRAGSIFLFSASSVVLFLILRMTIGNLPALAGSSFYLFIPYMFFSHIRAHRLELYLFLLLLFCFFILFGMSVSFGDSIPGKFTNPLITGVIGAALLLTRVESLLFFSAGILWFLFFSKLILKEKIIRAAIVFAVSLVLSCPFFINCRKDEGSFFYVLNVHSRFWDSHEHAGQPGFRSPENVLKDPYTGRDMSVAKYIFRDRGAGEIFFRFFRGYYRALTGYSPHFLSTPVNLRFLIYPVWLGLLLMFFAAKTRVLLFWGLLFILPHSFILNLHVVGQPSVDIRFAACSVPLLAFAFGTLFYFILLLTKKVKMFNILMR
ncbi:MAG: hypothetical protein ABIH68_03220 [bacterium]